MSSSDTVEGLLSLELLVPSIPSLGWSGSLSWFIFATCESKCEVVLLCIKGELMQILGVLRDETDSDEKRGEE